MPEAVPPFGSVTHVFDPPDPDSPAYRRLEEAAGVLAAAAQDYRDRPATDTHHALRRARTEFRSARIAYENGIDL